MAQPQVQALDRAVARALNVPLLDIGPDPERSPRLASILEYVEVRSVGQLQKELRRLEAEIVAFAAALQPEVQDAWTPAGGVRPGTSMVHYALWRACGNKSLDGDVLARLLDLRGSPGQLEQRVREVYAHLSAGQG